MLMYDDSFVAAMTATTDEATALGARIYGSEHVLLGLLVAHDHVTQHVVDMFPALTAPAVREAVRAALDDAPHLARLGLTLPAASATAAGAYSRHTNHHACLLRLYRSSFKLGRSTPKKGNRCFLATELG